MQTLTNIIKTSFLVLALTTVYMPLAVSEDDYLKQLELEAEEEFGSESSMPVSDGTSNTSLGASKTENELIFDKKELVVDQQSFERAMKSSYPESFELYQELNDEQKNIVYQGFVKEKRLYNASVKIISIYLSSH